jgi:hypothetical protein
MEGSSFSIVSRMDCHFLVSPPVPLLARVTNGLPGQELWAMSCFDLFRVLIATFMERPDPLVLSTEAPGLAFPRVRRYSVAKTLNEWGSPIASEGFQ